MAGGKKTYGSRQARMINRAKVKRMISANQFLKQQEHHIQKSIIRLEKAKKSLERAEKRLDNIMSKMDDIPFISNKFKKFFIMMQKANNNVKKFKNRVEIATIELS